MQPVPYGAALTIYRPMMLAGEYLTSAPAIAAGDIQISKDGGAFANVASLPTFTNNQLTIALSATELQAEQVTVRWVDQTATKEWDDDAAVLHTVGNASAMFEALPANVTQVDGSTTAAANLKLAADDNYTANRGLAGAALPNAAADAAGGLPVSDAGGLDIDAKLANTNEVTAARMAALTDWIDGGRLDLLLDAIKAVTDNLPDSGGLTTIDGKLDAIAVYIDTEIAAILTDTGTTLDGKIDAISALLGSPAGASVSADIAALVSANPDLTVAGSVNGATATTTVIPVTGLPLTAAGSYVGMYLIFVEGSNKALWREITANTGTAITLGSALPVAPSDTEVFRIGGKGC